MTGDAPSILTLLCCTNSGFFARVDITAHFATYHDLYHDPWPQNSPPSLYFPRRFTGFTVFSGELPLFSPDKYLLSTYPSDAKLRYTLPEHGFPHECCHLFSPLTGLGTIVSTSMHAKADLRC